MSDLRGVPLAVEARRKRPQSSVVKRPPERSGQQRREPHFPEDWMTTLWRELVKVRPALFDPRRLVPLALGFHRELHAVTKARLSGRRIRQFLAVWTGRTAYLRALAAPGAVRYGLRGPAGPVAPEHRDHALRRLEERRSLANDGLRPPSGGGDR
jgi:hypothetical protein